MKCPDIFQPEAVRRSAEIPRKLRNCMKLGPLCRRRQIADRHVIDHPPAQGAHLGHSHLLFEGWETTQSFKTEEKLANQPTHMPQ